MMEVLAYNLDHRFVLFTTENVKIQLLPFYLLLFYFEFHIVWTAEKSSAHLEMDDRQIFRGKKAPIYFPNRI